MGYVLIKAPEDQLPALLNALASDPQVVSAEPNYWVHAEEITPNDPGYPNQWGLTAIQAPAAWESTRGTSSVIIAVVDSGVDLNHPDLDQKILPGWDYVQNDSIPQDEFGHGTHVAGIAAAESNNGLGVSGVSWGAKILPVRVLDSTGNGTYANVAAGIVYAVDNGAQIINLSLGGSAPSGVLQDAVNYAYNQGVLLVAAAGNSGSNGVLYPARCDHVIGVAAVDSSLNRPWFSNYGMEVDLAAPGVSVYSTEPNFRGDYGFRNGTSMAAPFVSGAAALLMSLPGNEVPWLAAAQLMDSALDIGPAGWDVYHGAGLIQLAEAIRLVAPIPTPIPTENQKPGNEAPPMTPTPAPIHPALIVQTAPPPHAGTISDWPAPQSPTPTLPPNPDGLVQAQSIESGGSATETLTPQPISQESGKSQTFWMSKYWMPLLGLTLLILGLALLMLVSDQKQLPF